MVVAQGHLTFYSAARLDLEYFHVSEAFTMGQCKIPRLERSNGTR